MGLLPAEHLHVQAALILNPVALKVITNKNLLPICIPLTAMPAPWLCSEWAHSSSPQLISAEQPCAPTGFGSEAFHAAGSGLNSQMLARTRSWFLRAESSSHPPHPCSSSQRLPPSSRSRFPQIPPHPTAHTGSKLELPAPARHSVCCCLKTPSFTQPTSPLI